MTCWLRVKAPLYFYCSALNTPKVHALSASLLPSISFQFPRFLLIPRRTGCHCSTSTDFPHGAAWTWQYSPPGSISKTQPVQHRHWPEWLLVFILAQPNGRVSGWWLSAWLCNSETPCTQDFGKGNLPTHKSFLRFQILTNTKDTKAEWSPGCWQPIPQHQGEALWQCRELYAQSYGEWEVSAQVFSEKDIILSWMGIVKQLKLTYWK